MWVATLGQGLWFVAGVGNAPQVIGVHNGLSNDTIRTLYEDRNGDIGVGTTVNLHRFARRRVTPITGTMDLLSRAASRNAVARRLRHRATRQSDSETGRRVDCAMREVNASARHHPFGL
jgi:hypothetical protein